MKRREESDCEAGEVGGWVARRSRIRREKWKIRLEAEKVCVGICLCVGRDLESYFY